MKNFLDHFWREFAGKLFASVVASHEKGLTVTDQLRTVARQCYAWSMPYGVSFADREDVRDDLVHSEALRNRCHAGARRPGLWWSAGPPARCRPGRQRAGLPRATQEIKPELNRSSQRAQRTERGLKTEPERLSPRHPNRVGFHSFPLRLPLSCPLSVTSVSSCLNSDCATPWPRARIDATPSPS